MDVNGRWIFSDPENKVTSIQASLVDPYDWPQAGKNWVSVDATAIYVDVDSYCVVTRTPTRFPSPGPVHAPSTSPSTSPFFAPSTSPCNFFICQCVTFFLTFQF